MDIIPDSNNGDILSAQALGKLWNGPVTHDEPPLALFLAEGRAIARMILRAMIEHEKLYHGNADPHPRLVSDEEWRSSTRGGDGDDR